MSKERKELACGISWDEARAWESFNPDRHEIVHCQQTGMFQVFYIRRPRKRTVEKGIFRETRANNGTGLRARPLIMGIEPGDLLTVRRKGERTKYAIDANRLYNMLLQWTAQKVAADKMRARKQKRADKKALRKAGVA